MPIVETSVAVAIPSTTAVRITTGRPRPGIAIRNNLPLSPQVKRRAVERSSLLLCHHTTTESASMPTTAGNRPPVNRAAMETPVTDPTVISTMDGGIVHGHGVTREALSKALRRIIKRHLTHRQAVIADHSAA